MISYKDIALQIFSYSSQGDYNCYRVIANFCPKFRCHGNGVRWAKMRLAAFNGPSPKIPLQTQKSRRYFYTSQVIISFVPNFVAMATGVGRGKCNWQHSMANHNHNRWCDGRTPAGSLCQSLKEGRSDECRCADHKVTTPMKSDANTTE